MRWILLTISFSAQAATTVLIQGPQSSTLDYKAMLKAHADYVSPTAYYLSVHPDRRQRERLLNLFADAQKAFLEKSLEEARGRFQSVLALLPHDDWEKNDREVFLHAYLRLAQMETEASVRDRWLGLSLLLGDASLDNSLFPPPLLTRREQMRAELPKINPVKRLLANGWNEVLLNGQPCERGACTEWPAYSGSVRVTVISDQWSPQSAAVRVSEVESLTPPTIPLVEGGCEHDNYHSSANILAAKRSFWSLECEKVKPHVNLNPVPVAGAIDPLRAALPSSGKKEERFYQNKWFWAAVGSAVAIAVVASTQKKEKGSESKEPTSTYGY